MNGNGRNVHAKKSGNSSGLDGSPGTFNMTDFDLAEANRNGTMGSLNGSAKGTANGSSLRGENFYPSGGDTDTIKNQRFSLSRAIDFASTITTGDTVYDGIGPKAWAGNMTSHGWANSYARREAMWNQTNGFYNYRMMDKTLGVSGNGSGSDISTVWGSFSSSDHPQKRR